MEKPLLRISRPVSACSRCRRAKIKCVSSDRPACSACEKANQSIECSNVNDQLAKGKERSYVTALESRIEKLQEELALRRRYNIVGGIPEPAYDKSLDGQIDVDAKRDSTRTGSNRDDLEVDDLVSDFGLLSVNATTRDFHGFTTKMSFAKLVLSISHVEPMPVTFSSNLPAKATAIASFNHVLNTYFALYPIIPETALFGSLEAVYQNDGRYARAFDSFAVHMALAVAFASQSHAQQSDLHNRAVEHVNNALEYTESVLKPGSIIGIQATVLLAIYSLLDPSHFSCWFLVGIASRMMIDLGICQEVVIPKSPLDVPDVRQRIGQCVYNLDRASSIATLRALSFSDDSVDITPAEGAYYVNTIHPPRFVKDGNVFRSEFSGLLYRLRLMQSQWYHAILSSNPRERAKSWRTRKCYLEEAESWLAELPKPLPRAVYHLIYSETLYGILVLIFPSENFAELDLEGKELFIDKAFAYVHSTKELCSPNELNLGTCLDSHRCAFVGAKLVRLWNSSSAALSKIEKEIVVEALVGVKNIQDYQVLRYGSFRAWRQLEAELAEILQ